MLFVSAVTVLFIASSARATLSISYPIVRDGTELTLNGKRWAAVGANIYWLGLDENVKDSRNNPTYPTHDRVVEIMAVVNALNATVVRSHSLGISVGHVRSLEPSLGVFNDAAFEPMDWAIYQARQHGLRLMIPLIDNFDYYHGGKYTFLQWRGYNITRSTQSEKDANGNYIANLFYTDRTIINDFKQYIQHLITHKNQYSGLTYAEDTAIIAYATGNDLSGPNDGDQLVPNAWTKEIAQFIKSLAPNKLIIDGTAGVNKDHFAVSEIDIFTDHHYPPSVSKLNDHIASVNSTNRVFLVEEYDWRGVKGDTLKDFNWAIEKAHKLDKPVVAGDIFWSLFGHANPDCTSFVDHDDGYTMHYNDPANSASVISAIETQRLHFLRLRGLPADDPTLPIVPCPAS